ncbi:Zn-ribbon domain-containing OB-fold protein [Streptomyces fractus]|uniref:Zn-ribbon domain-containing OB-fold protein n=1 Tax=Streptomyces fractus TaxID=641806 RepID=UPI003CF41FA1
MSVSRPVPVPDAESAPYWEAAARHTLALARCGRCAAFALPPGPTCPHCHATEPGFSYEAVSGRGTVRSWTVVRQSALPGLADEVPFVLVDVELDEQAGLRMIGRLLDGPNSPPRMGDRVRVTFEDVEPGVSVPAFAHGEVAS